MSFFFLLLSSFLFSSLCFSLCILNKNIEKEKPTYHAQRDKRGLGCLVEGAEVARAEGTVMATAAASRTTATRSVVDEVWRKRNRRMATVSLFLLLLLSRVARAGVSFNARGSALCIAVLTAMDARCQLLLVGAKNQREFSLLKVSMSI